ncbi:MAG: GntR family transcriptional regulator [Pseudomonadota bacterium]
MSLDASELAIFPQTSSSASRVQRAFTALRDMVVTGRLMPGSSHLEVDIADMLGMSRTPVHEAAVMLEAEGLIKVRPRRGILVLPLSPGDMNEIYEILTELEPLAAAKLAESRPDEAALAPMAAELERMEACLTAGDREGWAQADDRFHAELVRRAGNRRLEEAVSRYSAQVQRARLLTLSLRPLPIASNVDHRNLFEAIAEGNAKAASDIHRRHRLMAKELLIGLIQKHGLTGV